MQTNIKKGYIDNLVKNSLVVNNEEIVNDINNKMSEELKKQLEVYIFIGICIILFFC